MDIAIRYHSRAGHTKKLAEVIGEATGAEALTVDVPIDRHVDILFIGASLYYEGIYSGMKDFIRSLHPDMVGKVYIFSTTCMTEYAYPELYRALRKQGLKVADENFRCWSEYNGFYVGKPDETDLENARQFAITAIEKETGNGKDDQHL